MTLPRPEWRFRERWPAPSESTAPWREADRLRFEKEALGFYLTGNPLLELEDQLRRLIMSPSDTPFWRTQLDPIDEPEASTSTLDVDAAAAAPLAPGDRVALRDTRGVLLAVLDLSEKYLYDREH